MIIYKDIAKIAELNNKRYELVKALETRSDLECDGIDWNTAKFVELSDEEIAKSFDPQTEVLDEYLVHQSVGVCGDDYHGYLYFKTDKPGVYVQVYFEM